MVQALMRGWWVRRMLRQTKARNAVIHMTEKMVNQAGAHLNDGRHEKAVDLASEAIVLDDGYSHAYVVRAHAKYAQQQFEPAAEDYSVAIAREPKNREALHGRARCYGSLEQWDSAIRDVNHLMDAQPDNPDHWALRAMLRSKLRLWALAAQDMTTFMEKGSRNVKALIQRGSCYAADQDWHSALRCVRVGDEAMGGRGGGGGSARRSWPPVAVAVTVVAAAAVAAADPADLSPPRCPPSSLPRTLHPPPSLISPPALSLPIPATFRTRSGYNRRLSGHSASAVARTVACADSIAR